MKLILKTLSILIVIIGILAGCNSAIDSANNESLTEVDSNTKEPIVENEKTVKIEPIEETPPLETCTSDIGIIKSDGNVSLGKKTEMTELLKQMQNSSCDIIEISYVNSFPDPKYDPNMPLKVTYNRRTSTLNHELMMAEFTNVNEDCLIKFLKQGHKGFFGLTDFCAGMEFKTKYPEVNETPIGKKPEQSEWDASVQIVKDYIKSNANDASSIEFLEWSKVSSAGEYWVVRCKFKGTNSFGGVVTENKWFYMQNNEVVKTK